MFPKIAFITFLLAATIACVFTLGGTKTSRAATGWAKLGSPCKSRKLINLSATEDVVAVGCSDGSVYGYFVH